ncbi:MAG: hypothetical protein QM724_08160 [Flavobacteriales bacterium]
MSRSEVVTLTGEEDEVRLRALSGSRWHVTRATLLRLMDRYDAGDLDDMALFGITSLMEARTDLSYEPGSEDEIGSAIFSLAMPRHDAWSLERTRKELLQVHLDVSPTGWERAAEIEAIRPGPRPLHVHLTRAVMRNFLERLLDREIDPHELGAIAVHLGSIGELRYEPGHGEVLRGLLDRLRLPHERGTLTPAEALGWLRRIGA